MMEKLQTSFKIRCRSKNSTRIVLDQNFQVDDLETISISASCMSRKYDWKQKQNTTQVKLTHQKTFVIKLN